MKYIDALKKYKRLVIVDQMDIQKEYGVSWDDLGPFLKIIELPCNLKSDKATEDGFEEAIWETEIDGLKIRDTTIYGIGSITELEIIEME